jgi:diaphanous 1
LHTLSLKVYTLASELLAAICILSLTEGHRAVLAAMSDFRIAFEENFRFETLIASLRLPDVDIDSESDNGVSFGNEKEGVWEARTASMALINALANSPESLEERIMLREEFGRRGLNEVIVVRDLIYLFLSVRIGGFLADFEIHQTSRFLVDST